MTTLTGPQARGHSNVHPSDLTGRNKLRLDQEKREREYLEATRQTALDQLPDILECIADLELWREAVNDWTAWVEKENVELRTEIAELRAGK